MNTPQQPPKLNVDLKQTTQIQDENGDIVFQQGVILRKVSKFLVGGEEDGILPIPVFYNPNTSKILESTLPKEIKEELKDHLIKG